MSSAGPELVSVVIPVRNGESTIGAQLAALEAQEAAGPWELVVSDNGSTDATRVLLQGWAARLPLRVVDASRQPGVGHARNVGVAAARGDRILMCDADDVVSLGWRHCLAEALGDHDLATGPLERATLNRRYQERWPGAALTTGPRVAHHHLPMAPGGNLAFRRAVFEKLGGFDEALRRAEDLDFVWRGLRSGASLGFAPEAIVSVRLRATARATLRQGLEDGYYEPSLFRRHRQWGMARESLADAAREYRQLAAELPGAVRGRHAYSWAYDFGQRLGRLGGSVRHRCLFP